MDLKRILKLTLFFNLFIFFKIAPAVPFSYTLEKPFDQPFAGLASNTVIEIVWDGTYVWVGTGKGVSRTSDGGLRWESFDRTNGLTSSEISALAVSSNGLWAGVLHTEQGFGYGDGFNFTSDFGSNWLSFIPSQANFFGKYAFDIALQDTVVWASVWYGGLIRSLDNGATWQNVYYDSTSKADSINYLDLANRYFAVVADTFQTDTALIWAGTAAGIIKYVYTNADTFDTVARYTYALDSISGDFVTALAVQKFQNQKIVWAATRPSQQGRLQSSSAPIVGQMGVSFTRDDGATWDTTLLNEEVWNFDFSDSVVWAATSSGLKRSLDLGKTWTSFDASNIIDTLTGDRLFSSTFFAVRLVNDTVWAGGLEGVIRSPDRGRTWIFRSFVLIGTPGTPSAYAAPTPFSPLQQLGGALLWYKPASGCNATLKIYDFGMNLVAEQTQNLPPGQEGHCHFSWDGRNQKGDLVANGVYFFVVEMQNGKTEWGKVVVIK